MVREDVEKLLEQKQFIEAEKTLIKLLETSSQLTDEEDVLWQKLIEIQIKNSSINLVKTSTNYLKLLTTSSIKNKNEKMLEVLERLKEEVSLTIDQWSQYHELLWLRGQVQKYHRSVDSLLDSFVLQKNIPGLSKLLPEILKKNQLWPKPRICLLMLYQFSNDASKAIETASELLEIVDSKWKLLNYKKISAQSYHIRVLNILNSIEGKDVYLESFKLKLKSKIHTKFNNPKYRLSKREIIEFLIVDKENFDSVLIALSSMGEGSLKQELVTIAQQHKSFEIKYITKNYPNLHNLFEQKLVATYSRPIENNERVDIEIKSVLSKRSQLKPNYERNIPYICSIEEKEIIAQIQQDEYIANNPNDLALAFKEMGYFQASIVILKHRPLNIERLYILCEILFELKRFVDVIAEINDAIVIGLFESDLPIEFKYLEAESYLKIGNTHKAIKIFNEIMLENPSFRQVKERLRNA